MKLKRLLIISPYFPPSNAADMQRIRMSLPYFKEFGWQAEVVIVNPLHSEMVKDSLLLKTIPEDIIIHTVGAFSKKWTSKFGLGSLALRSLWFYRKKVANLLKQNKYDLIYFSTTQFPVCILGAYWKKRFNVPYVIDMQDPWHSTYYLDKPKSERPPKHWFSYHLNKYLEPIAMKNVDGIISVSEFYISQLKSRYNNIPLIPTETITFGYFEKDFEIAKQFSDRVSLTYEREVGKLNLIYVGRGGYDMQPAVKVLFEAFKLLLHEDYQTFKKIKFHFIGTSYAKSGSGAKTIMPIAEEVGVADFVNEQTDRVSFFENIKCLQFADALIVPGSNDGSYTASKIFPYILTEKPLLAIFNASSSSFDIIRKVEGRTVVEINSVETVEMIKVFLRNFVNQPRGNTGTNWVYLERYSAKALTEKQCILFNKTIEKFGSITKSDYQNDGALNVKH